MDLRNKLIGLACDNRASDATTLQIRVPSTLSQSPAKVKGSAVFHGDRERQLGSGGFSPFVESVCGNEATPLCESPPERGRPIDRLGSGVDGPISDLWIFRPIWN